MPIGNPTYFQRDIRKFNPNAFGFFYCKIFAPSGLLHPILQLHHNSKDGIRTIAPLGEWEGMYFSEELYNAPKFGYKFEVLWGYTFDADFVFTDFINDLHKLRLDYPKSDPMNFSAKLLMNAAYGRFGMDDNFSYIEILTKDEYGPFEKANIDSIINVIPLGDNYLVQLKYKQDIMDTMLDNGSENHNINISIASAISAYARINMAQFKNKKYNLYYSDTDSIFIDQPLEDYFINGTELGKMKLEGVYSKAIF